MDGIVPDPGLAVTRQRRRMEQVLVGLSPEAWACPSRCDGWSVRDVVAHLATVNQFFEASVRAGRAGTPTKMLASFDPAADPDLLVESLGPISTNEVFEMFVASNDGFLGAVAEMSGDEWSLLAESPAGHVGIDRVVDHALWDSWVHERDIAVPLGLVMEEEADELAACLRYVAAIGPALNAGKLGSFSGSLTVMATDPDMQFILEVGEAVAVKEDAGASSGPCLRGTAADLIEALSLRSAPPADAPSDWLLMMAGLAAAFAAE